MPPAWTNSGIGELGEDAGVGLSGRTDVADQRRGLALEHRHQAGDGSLDGLLVHDVGLIETGGRPVVGIVADLDPEGRTGRDRAARGRPTGQRTGGRRCGGRRGDGRPCRVHLLPLGGHHGDDHGDGHHGERPEDVPPGARATTPGLLAQLLSREDGGARAGRTLGGAAGVGSGGVLIVRHWRKRLPRTGRPEVDGARPGSFPVAGRAGRPIEAAGSPLTPGAARIHHRTCVRV